MHLTSVAQSLAAGHQPSILLAATCPWSGPAWLAIVLARVGCQVFAVTPPRHPMRSVRSVSRHIRYPILGSVPALKRAIEATEPDFVVPCDDRALRHLHEIHASEPGMRGLIERSLGSPEAFRVTQSRIDLLNLARREGVLVPEHAPLESIADLRAWQARHPAFPWVMKIDGSWGGGGVRIVHGWEEAEATFSELKRMPTFKHMVSQVVYGADPFWLLQWWKRERTAQSVQTFIDGRAANCVVSCWEGEMLGGIAVEVLAETHERGPSTIVRVVENATMLDAASRIVGALGLTGFVGFDFMIENATGAPYLVEMNARATPTCHLQLGQGRDLVAPLYARLSGSDARDWPPVTRNDKIALFPDAWLSNPSSASLAESYHDVPWSEPDLVRKLIRPPRLRADNIIRAGLSALKSAPERRRGGLSVQSSATKG